ncbi:dipeptidase [Streptomyces sp. NPDC051561]|uniref:dipeptidase n=1 Tax=Streptomyces sp. NPDC051561 TaxID=3365658 RepID=UPI003795C779
MALLQDDPHASPAAGRLPEEPPADPATKPDPPVPDTATPTKSPAEGTPESFLARARALLAAHPVADGYNGLVWALRSVPWSDIELGESSLDTDIPRLRSGGVGAQFWSLHTEGPDAVAATLEQIDRVLALIRGHSEGLRLALSAGEIGDAHSCGRIASLLGPAAAPAIGDSLGALRSLHALGVRCLTLTGTDWAPPTGLTRFGQEVVREMNRTGVLADLSGTTAETARAVLAVSKAPVAFTRSGAHAVGAHPANVSDDVLTALRENAGLCMVPLDADRTGPALRDVADHLDHVRALAGPDCVGLSGTYDTGAGHPVGLPDATGYPLLVAELLGRGWAEGDVAKLTWGNLQRVLRDVEFTARAAQQRRGASTARVEELDG